MNRRQFFPTVPVVLAGAAVAKAKPAAREEDDDHWCASLKKTRHNLPCEEHMAMRVQDVLDALDGVEQSRGRLDQFAVDECYHIRHFVEAGYCAIEAEMLFFPAKRRQRPRRHPQITNPVERVLFAMYDAQQAIEKVHEAHGMDCPCEFCWDAEHLRWFLEGQASLLDGITVPSLSYLEYRHGKPLADLVAEKLARKPTKG